MSKMLNKSFARQRQHILANSRVKEKRNNTNEKRKYK